jgi:cytidine deaminase
MDDELFEAARAARERAHAPYSEYPVGAAIRTESGAVHAGCNVENASFPEGWCAETSAIAAMIGASSTGSGRRIAAVCVVAEPIEGRLTTPCGGCRQRLAEFGGADTAVHVADPDGNSRTFRLGDLLPAAFALEAKA